jgi:hypothetical protein
MVWLVGCVGSMGLWSWRAALGWSIGSLISGGVVRGVEVAVRGAISPGSLDGKRVLARFTFVKMVAVCAAIVLVILTAGSDAQIIIGMCVGLLLVQAVMLALGIRILLRGDALE